MSESNILFGLIGRLFIGSLLVKLFIWRSKVLNMLLEFDVLGLGRPGFVAGRKLLADRKGFK